VPPRARPCRSRQAAGTRTAQPLRGG